MDESETPQEPPGCYALLDPAPWGAVSSLQWLDWKWQLRHRITKFEQLSSLIHLTNYEIEGLRGVGGKLAMAITPYFASLMDPHDPCCPIRRQAIPTRDESLVAPSDLVDPCGEDSHIAVPGLVHRYPDRVLLLVTDKCAMYCRYCTRRRQVGRRENHISSENLDNAYRYIQNHKEIRDVLVSGGDPLLLEQSRLEVILSRLRSIPHVEILRIGTRVPCTLPMRVDSSLAGMLKEFHPLYMSLHFSHPKEITPEVKQACSLLADAGIPLGSQTVLLRGINDQPETMKKLFHELLKIRVKPYYLYQCDLAVGTSHFRTPVDKGIEILENLRGYTSGYAIPTYVIDSPGGGGKVPMSPDYVIERANGEVIFRNYEGKIFKYAEGEST